MFVNEKNKVMVIRIQKNSVDLYRLYEYLSNTFQNYKVSLGKNNVITIVKGPWAIKITVKKTRISISKALSHPQYYVIAGMLFIALGVILPIIIYSVFIYPRMSMFVQEILEATYAYYRSHVLNYTQHQAYDGEEE